MSFTLAIALLTVVGLLVASWAGSTLQSSPEDEPPSPPDPSPSRQVVDVVVAALLEDDESVIVAFAPPSTPAVSALPSRDWGTVVVERPRPETLRTLEAWRQSNQRLVMVVEAPSDEDGRQLRLGVPQGLTVVLSA
jgi:hypothetical protein